MSNENVYSTLISTKILFVVLIYIIIYEENLILCIPYFNPIFLETAKIYNVSQKSPFKDFYEQLDDIFQN